MPTAGESPGCPGRLPSCLYRSRRPMIHLRQQGARQNALPRSVFRFLLSLRKLDANSRHSREACPRFHEDRLRGAIAPSLVLQSQLVSRGIDQLWLLKLPATGNAPSRNEFAQSPRSKLQSRLMCGCSIRNYLKREYDMPAIAIGKMPGVWIPAFAGMTVWATEVLR